MKFSGNAQSVLEGINIVTRALASKSIKPIFDGVLVEGNNNNLSMTCSDGQFSIRWTGNATVEESGTTIIPGRLFSELIRKIPNVPTSIKTDDKTALITYGKSRSRLSVISGEYPQPDVITNPESVTIPASALRDMINHIISSVATDQSRIILTGGLLDISPDTINMVSLDGFRLAAKHYAQENDIHADRVRAIIPRKTLMELSRILPADDSPVFIDIGSGKIRITFGNVQITSVLIAGEYMDYEKIIPQTFASSIRTSKQELSDAIDRASLMAREGKNNLIRMDISDNGVTISARAETGNVEESVECLQNGNDITIAFNSNYLVDALKNLPGDNVTMKFNSTVSPAIFSPDSGNDWLYLILPVRVQND